jgi:hypothetical protein
MRPKSVGGSAKKDSAAEKTARRLASLSGMENKKKRDQVIARIRKNRSPNAVKRARKAYVRIVTTGK